MVEAQNRAKEKEDKLQFNILSFCLANLAIVDLSICLRGGVLHEQFKKIINSRHRLLKWSIIQCMNKGMGMRQ